MKLTKKKLKSFYPCEDGYQWYLEQKTEDLQEICNRLLNDKQLTDVYLIWLLPRMMNKKQRVQFAVYCAELVIDNFEKEYPDDDWPRKAIEVAKRYINNQTQESAAVCSSSSVISKTNSAAAYAAAASGTEARSDARFAAAYAADAAAYAAGAAADARSAAVYAARSAANAADRSAAAAIRSETIYKCAHYGMQILGLEVTK